MNRRAFLAALPLVPAALAALRPARREPLIFGTVWKDGKWIAGNGTTETWREVEVRPPLRHQLTADIRSARTILDLTLAGNDETLRQLEEARRSGEEVALAFGGERRPYRVQGIEQHLDGWARVYLSSTSWEHSG